MLDINDLHRERDSLHAHAGNVMRLLQGIRANDGSFNRPVVSLTIAGARNAAEAYLKTLDEAERESLAAVEERERTRALRSFPSFSAASPQVAVRRLPSDADFVSPAVA